MNTTLLVIAGIAVLVTVFALVKKKLFAAKAKVKIADIAAIFEKLHAVGKDGSFAVFVFTPPGALSQDEAISDQRPIRTVPCSLKSRDVSSVPYSLCLLDDDASMLKALGRLLASAGLTTEKFTEPARFLAYAQSHPIRLAVIDVHLPGMCGFACC